ncbi:hypothetical protein PHYSODRAFT_343192 [Phytophthora sojae]|uniref:Uncharacterized protein n=1 Tax=Phytophthora sojae (strain P6497) TaxID=1094619 RepID=G5AIX4_PHYSP|nr:hypothetical protein PHYSODRAFT_340647 [Phytophthora sojae]XP_009540025.1 hypothetical protein PHYSODRAFT_343192 [Phytophthora sojae]EGZ04529.1 hypothetical protein PHYSODRAFT_343192 [Phytophthora sojae]EGZ07571.1 hypothetical protein PHYSODRAFT_340647 [Phytophthora sojae]|eukprot:XP_009537137.1 hypothetical protein PHYSODRAFT_340647 [Phytophthora sojae]
MEAAAHAANARLRGDQDGGHGAGVARGERVRRAKDEGSVDGPAELGEKSKGEKSTEALSVLKKDDQRGDGGVKKKT